MRLQNRATKKKYFTRTQPLTQVIASKEEDENLPGIQTHRKVPGSSRQEPSFLQGWLSHSLTLVSHRGPVKPTEQLQANEPGVFTQIPSCSHGDPEIVTNL